ncbi:putative permease [Flavobacterium beibuense]|uniref:Putative permease n=2 Tax=Flavobacterium beibuense TaxID=657326 RepID=A0A444WBX7_9FLAO|nr:putative permease [Flavobacterium beibuense]
MTFNFKKWNTILGWTVFTIALVVYSLTVEPTLSFWDCGEYIPTAAKLEVGHPPGAPLFQMVGAFFAMFATAPDKIALMVNMVSVVSSAFTILFMFWSLTMLLRTLLERFSEFNNNNALMVLGSAAVGSLAFTFTDSFWFNATEAEVYAMASLFISLLLWLGLRWEQDMNTPRGNKWLLIISLVVGLSFGVHFMALLTIPAIGFIYYFKNYEKITVKSFIIANIVIVAILLFIFKLLLPYTLALFGKTEIFMVNKMGLPFNSGTIFMALLIVALFYFGLNYTRKNNYALANTLVLCVLFIFIGFSTWMMLPIRANANVVINENRPSDAAEVLAYYNREQYGEQKLFYGPMFSDTYAGLDKENPYEDEKPNYQRDYKKGEYVIVNDYENAKQNTDDNHKGFMPRMWSTEHAVNYMNFTRPLDFRIDPNYDFSQDLVQYGLPLDQMSDEEVGKAMAQVRDELQNVITQFKTGYQQGKMDLEDYDRFLKNYSQYLIIDKPSFADNMKFMFEYQFGYMYFRYFMWNFSGRQNDIQGRYDNYDGNWMSGIKVIDEARLGSQDNLPSDQLNNKARNFYYLLPLILGLIGLAYHASKDLKSFYVLLVLFLFTGLALKIYLNERPFEPRERDYALVGSFYVFAIWIGFGVYAIYDSIKKFLAPKIAGPIVLAITMLAGPVLLASENWDDHDRSDRYTALAMAKAYLESCDQNAILFTIGDNDTFPLWYAQEVEGIRTDIRIVNTSLFMTDWYIDQMKAKAYESEPLPISFTHDQYVQGTRDYMFLDRRTDKRLDINDFMEFIASDDPRTKVELRNGHMINYFPTNKIRLNVDRESVIKNKIVAPELYDSIVPYIDIDIKGDALYKNRLLMLDLVNNNNWERPIYFTGGSFGDDDYLWMKDYLQLDGMVFKLIPVKTPIPKEGSLLDMGNIDSDKMYDIVMSWDWGNSESPEIYHDPETRKNSITYRTNLARLMEKLMAEGKNEKAKNIADLAMTKMPVEYFNYYTLLEPYATAYYKLGEKEKAQDLLKKLITKYQENLTFYKGLAASEQNHIVVDIITDIERYRSLLLIMKDEGDLELYSKEKPVFNKYNKMFERFERDNEE